MKSMLRGFLLLILTVAVSSPPWLHGHGVSPVRISMSAVVHDIHNGHGARVGEHAPPHTHKQSVADLAQQQLCLTACACLPAPFLAPAGQRVFGLSEKLGLEPKMLACQSGTDGPFRPPKQFS